MKTPSLTVWPVVVVCAALMSSCKDKGLEIKVEVTPSGEEEYVPMVLDNSLELEVLDVTTQLLKQKDDLEFGARSNNNAVQVGSIWRGHADVEIRPYGDTFQLAGYTFEFDGFELSVDGKKLGTVSSTDQVRVSSGGVDVERG